MKQISRQVERTKAERRNCGRQGEIIVEGEEKR
jgi:hypothetical protein